MENESAGREEPLLQTPLRVLMPSGDCEINSLMGNDVKTTVERSGSQNNFEDGNGSKGDQEGESWEESCLKNFSKCMGMSIKGFEEDFPELMIKVAKRRNKGKNKGVAQI